jgi:hypothetical protein
MGEILGLGMTHWPPLAFADERLTGTFKRTLGAPNVPACYKDPANWPARLKEELGSDEGLAAARACSARLADDFRTVRRALDEFNPDLVVIWGDDQYENFKEDIVPPFCVYGYDDEIELRPWQGRDGPRPNRWNEPGDWVFPFHGYREAAKYLTSGLIRHGIDMPYAYKPLHQPGLSHAFLNTLLFLDWDRRGFPYRVIPFAVNCYGSQLLSAKGGLAALFDPPSDRTLLPDPPAPMPWRCMDVGAAVAEIFAASPWRVALIASASWSHAFLSPRHGYLWADIESDRVLFEALKTGDYGVWRQRSIEQTEAAGQHEMLNWMLLVGAMEKLGRRPVVHDYMESYLFTSQKCFVSFPP